MPRTARRSSGGGDDWIAAIAGGLNGLAGGLGNIEEDKLRRQQVAAQEAQRQEELELRRQEIADRFTDRKAAAERQQALDAAAAEATAVKGADAGVTRSRSVYGTDRDLPGTVAQLAARAGRSDELQWQQPTNPVHAAVSDLGMGPAAARFVPTAEEREQKDTRRLVMEMAEKMRATNPAGAQALEFNAQVGKIGPMTADAFVSPQQKQQQGIDAEVAKQTALLPIKLREREGAAAIDARHRPAQPGGMSPGQAAGARAMADDYTRDSKPFSERGQAFDAIATAAKTNSPAADMSLIYGYMKMMDPGSVVRESEYATAQNAAGVPDRIRNAYNAVVNGSRLTPEQRKQFVSEAGSLYKTAKTRQDRITKAYTDRATKQGIDPSHVIMDYGASEPLPDDAPGKDPLGIR